MKPRLGTSSVAGTLVLISSLLLACMAQAQTDWTFDPGNPVIPSSVGGGYALDPSVLYDSATGLYRMWFTAYPYDGSWSIYYALSPDGTHWFSYARNPVLTGGGMPFEQDGVVYAGVVYDGTQYRMYYTGVQGCCGSAVGLALSPDGITWTKYSGNPVLTPSASGWDSGSIGASNSVYYDGHTYYLLYQGVGASTGLQTGRSAWQNSLHDRIARLTVAAGPSQQIGVATSTDGMTFTKSPLNPVIPTGGSGAWDEGGLFPGGIFQHDGVLCAFYAGVPSDFSRESLGLATSKDGLTWAKDAHGPIFSGSSSWDWNIGSGWPVLRGGTVQLWYTGNSDGGNAWAIGYATAPRPKLHLGSSGAGAETRDALREEVRIPAQPVLKFLGAQPNPATDGIAASFTLPTRGRVALELFDLAGRRVLPRVNLELGPGSHVLPLLPKDAAAPGVYVLRMSFEGDVLESRVVVAR